MTRAIQTLTASLIDYAGLFPPAKLAMPAAAESYARALRSPHAPVLGRFICPSKRLAEFSQAAAPLMPGTFATSGYREYADIAEPWRVSVLIDDDLGACLDRLDEFNRRHASPDGGLARADAVEMKIDAPSDIDPALDELPEDIFPFFEVPIDGDCRGFVTAIAGNSDSGGAAAKVRTGGVTPEAFPTTRQVAEFLHACIGAQVPFKATAGLHHPIRGVQRLTYEPDSPSGTMHGFVNLFMAAGLTRMHRLDVAATQTILEDTSPDSFRFTDDGASWRNRTIDVVALARVREAFALGFGSCSFDEPIEDLRSLGWL
jgi:hypothetical protein